VVNAGKKTDSRTVNGREYLVLNNPGDRKYQKAGNNDGSRCFLVKGVLAMITGNPLCLSFPLILE